jgi:hypothetical protein
MSRSINTKPPTFNLTTLNSKLLASGSKLGRRQVTQAVYQEQSDLGKLIFIIGIFLLLAFGMLVLFTDTKNMPKYMTYKTDTQSSGWDRVKSWFQCDRQLCTDLPNATQQSKIPGITNSAGYDETRQCWME